MSLPYVKNVRIKINKDAKSVVLGFRVHAPNKSRALHNFSERLAPPEVEFVLKEVMQGKL